MTFPTHADRSDPRRRARAGAGRGLSLSDVQAYPPTPVRRSLREQSKRLDQGRSRSSLGRVGGADADDLIAPARPSVSGRVPNLKRRYRPSSKRSVRCDKREAPAFPRKRAPRPRRATGRPVKATSDHVSAPTQPTSCPLECGLTAPGGNSAPCGRVDPAV
jgi:hypothetical protein